MKKLTYLTLLLFFQLFSCKQSDQTATKKSADKYEKSKLTLEEIEKKDPLKFLTVTSYDKRNIIGQTVLKGTILNKATVVSYKDAEIKISFFSKTGSLLEEDVETVYEIIKPGSSANFKSKYFAPKGTGLVKMTINEAKVAY
jgi:hypothetical protein